MTERSPSEQKDSPLPSNAPFAALIAVDLSVRGSLQPASYCDKSSSTGTRLYDLDPDWGPDD